MSDRYKALTIRSLDDYRDCLAMEPRVVSCVKVGDPVESSISRWIQGLVIGEDRMNFTCVQDVFEAGRKS
jgi:hypothetical protein